MLTVTGSLSSDHESIVHPFTLSPSAATWRRPCRRADPRTDRVVNYRTARTELEQQTAARASFEIGTAARRLDDFIVRIGMLPRSTASRQQVCGRDPDPGMVPLMAQLLSQVPVDEVYGLAMAFENKDWREEDAMPWVDARAGRTGIGWVTLPRPETGMVQRHQGQADLFASPNPTLTRTVPISRW